MTALAASGPRLVTLTSKARVRPTLGRASPEPSFRPRSAESAPAAGPAAASARAATAHHPRLRLRNFIATRLRILIFGLSGCYLAQRTGTSMELRGHAMGRDIARRCPVRALRTAQRAIPTRQTQNGIGGTSGTIGPSPRLQPLMLGRFGERVIHRHGEADRDTSPNRRPPVPTRDQVVADDGRGGPGHIDKRRTDGVP